MTDWSTLAPVVLEQARQRTDGHSRRLFHGRGHCYAGLEHLTLDRFGDYLHLSTYRAPDTDCRPLVEPLLQLFPDTRGISLQHRDGRRTQGAVLWGDVPDRVVAEEAGLSFWVELHAAQNIGFFLDMAPTRAWLREHVDGGRVLNLFAYTCAFSVAAIAAGAARVVNVDMARRTLDWGRRNHELNGQDLRRVLMLGHDVRKSWSRLRRAAPFDVLIIDPPTNQPGSFNTESDYAQVLRRIPQLVARGGYVICAVNSPYLNRDFIGMQMARWQPACALVHSMPTSEDFPEQDADAGLKVEVYRLSG